MTVWKNCHRFASNNDVVLPCLRVRSSNCAKKARIDSTNSLGKRGSEHLEGTSLWLRRPFDSAADDAECSVTGGASRIYCFALTYTMFFGERTLSPNQRYAVRNPSFAIL
jgi:hypothetical protein